MPENIIAHIRYLTAKLKGYSHYRAFEEIEGTRYLVSLMKINGKWSLSITEV